MSCFHWPRGVQACARLQQLLEWIRSAGFGEAGERFFRKLSCTLNLLATPSAQLIQVRGAGGRWLLRAQQLEVPAGRRSAPQACPTVRDPTDRSPPGSCPWGFSRQETWSALRTFLQLQPLVPSCYPAGRVTAQHVRVSSLTYSSGTGALLAGGGEGPRGGAVTPVTWSPGSPI